MDVRCPVCDETLNGRVGDLSMILREHLEAKHDIFASETETERQVRTFNDTDPSMLPAERRERVEEVAQFREPRTVETPEERAVETFSGREPYGADRPRTDVERVTQFREPRLAESKDECYTRTFSESQCEVQPAEDKVLHEEVRQWRYPRVGPEGERGPAFLCPVCNRAMDAADEDSLSVELKEHFTEAHALDRLKMKNRP